jgi:group I intron endonuclease
MSLRVTIELAGPPRGGVVYRITNRATGAAYIGITASSAAERFAAHWKASKREDGALYRAFRKYGKAAFSVEVIALAESSDRLCEMERELIAAHRTHVRDGGYNMTGGGEGSPDICDETRKRMQAAAAQRMADPDIRAKIAASLTGRRLSPEHIAKSAAARRGRPLSADHRLKVSLGQIGRVVTESQRQKIAAALRGRKLPPERVQAAIAGRKSREHSDETKRRLSAAASTPEARARRSENSKRAWNNPQRRAAHSDRMTNRNPRRPADAS